MIKLHPGAALMAHRLIVNGQIHPLSVARFDTGADGGWHLRIYPFDGECHSTYFVNGTVEITYTEGSAVMPVLKKA